MDVPSLEGLSYDHEVHKGRVGAASNTDLVDFRSLYLGNFLDVVRTVGTGDKRLQLTKADSHLLVVLGTIVWFQITPVLRPSLRLEEGPCPLIAGEDARRSPELGPHVGDGRALGDREIFDARAAVLKDTADAPFDGQAPE